MTQTAKATSTQPPTSRRMGFFGGSTGLDVRLELERLRLLELLRVEGLRLELLRVELLRLELPLFDVPPLLDVPPLFFFVVVLVVFFVDVDVDFFCVVEATLCTVTENSQKVINLTKKLTFPFHSFFTVSAFAEATCVRMTLQRRKFPTNVSVHIYRISHLFSLCDRFPVSF